jgi:polysaccharide pyruvyl transferase WcaK-like protein
MTSNTARDLYSRAVRAFGRGRRASLPRRGAADRAGRILIVPPARHRGSLGDEAMMTALAQRVLARGAREVALLSSDLNDAWGIPGTTAAVVSDEGVLGAYTEAFRFVSAVLRHEHCYVIGADVLDGYYSESTALRLLRLAAAAADAGVPCTIAGFSLNAAPRPAVVHALRTLPESVRLVCRDAVSQRRLVQHVGRPADLAADLAFLLAPAVDSPGVREILGWIEAQKRDGRLVIGINANPLVAARDGEGADAVLAARYGDMLVDLASDASRASFVLIPHDVRPGIGDVDVIARIAASLPSAVRARCRMIDAGVRAAEVKAICGALDVVVSGRMHLAIAALGQSVPAACIAYQGKFEGLFQHFQLGDLTIEPDKALIPGALSAFVGGMLDRRAAIRESIARALPGVLALATKNIGR